MTDQILITGGTGFAGSHLVEALLADQVPINNIHTTNFAQKPSFVDSLLSPENIHLLDLTDSEATFALFSKIKPTRIYHLASFSSPSLSLENTTKAIETNVEIQMNVLEAMRQHTPAARLLSIGSASEYAGSNEPLTEGHVLGPHDPYGVSKVAQDMLAYSYSVRFELDIVRVRPFNHIGERQELGFVVSDFAQQIVQIERGEQTELTAGNLQVTRDFSDVKDVVQAYILLMSAGQAGEVYNVGSGQDITIENLLAKMKALAKINFPILVQERKQRPGDIQRSVANINKIAKLGWQATISLEKTLERILSWWREQ
jgi:GDP-4-dehydro-6-deoxy-D-mannose reductase